MSKPAARITVDAQVCPMFDGPKPHVGGIIMGPGVPTVLIGGIPAAVVGDMTQCVGPPGNIVIGSMGVLIGGKPAARMGDMTSHGGIISTGLPTVLIGDIGMGSPANLIAVLEYILDNVPQEMHDQIQDTIVLMNAAQSASLGASKCSG